MLEMFFGLKPLLFLVGSCKFDGCCHSGMMLWWKRLIIITA